MIVKRKELDLFFTTPLPKSTGSEKYGFALSKIAPRIFQACEKLEVCLPPLRLSSDLLAVCSQGLQKALTRFDGHSYYRSPTGLQSGGARMGTGWGPGWGPIGSPNRAFTGSETWSSLLKDFAGPLLGSPNWT